MDDKPLTGECVKPRRRWYQFSLRTLLIGVSLLAVISFGLAKLAAIVEPGPDAENNALRPKVENNALVKQTLSSILAKYGKPDSDVPGYKELGFYTPSKLPPGPIRTLIFNHQEGGTLWVWVEQRGNDWICFESCWFADGVMF